MGETGEIRIPVGLDWETWVRRWDLMQERYLERRDERFAVISQVISDAQVKPEKILDLGCGTGSLMSHLLEAFPAAEVYGIDLDSTLLPLARSRMEHFGPRARLIQADLREPDWVARVPRDLNVIVSATALHWLNEKQLKRLYGQLTEIMAPGGIFLNADHAASAHAPLQKAWEAQRTIYQTNMAKGEAESWEDFWTLIS